MGKVHDGIDGVLASWISAQPMWFLATAPLAADGRVNVSPRGHDSFSVLGRHRVGWVDYTGSGVPRIVRLHGRGVLSLPDEPAFEDSCGYGVPVMELVGERDLLRLDAEKRGAQGLAAYRVEKNSRSIDGLPGL